MEVEFYLHGFTKHAAPRPHYNHNGAASGIILDSPKSVWCTLTQSYQLRSCVNIATFSTARTTTAPGPRSVSQNAAVLYKRMRVAFIVQQ